MITVFLLLALSAFVCTIVAVLRAGLPTVRRLAPMAGTDLPGGSAAMKAGDLRTLYTLLAEFRAEHLSRDESARLVLGDVAREIIDSERPGSERAHGDARDDEASRRSDVGRDIPRFDSTRRRP